ncbi:glycoside hydrolase superfamily [Kockiozyma suomiensis]|uniref:glycoside hydrolase superfamily n=1 Tax=Kockiozyma suomiensis TaxID=1337062 RepID=UPI003343ED6D
MLDIEDTVAKLSQSDKVRLLSGADFWHTAAVPELGIPSLRFTDGPNGVRGTRFFNGVPAACFPCGTALGATFDYDLMIRAGSTMGEEAKAKGAHVILGPTVNMQRGPLGGRGFESFSEDPVLSGLTAAAVISGIQSTNVTATLKHFVCNDQEHERNSVNSILTERALREIYLLPFQIAIRDSKPGAIMTAYNRVNGVHASQSTYLLDEVLRKEWSWDGLIMSDWYGTYSTADAINAGLDIDMPGPTSFRGFLVERDVNAKLIAQHTIDERVRTVLKLVNRAEKACIPHDASEKALDTPETAALLRKIAADSIVLLKNDKSVLPLSKDKMTAVIGPNAKISTYCGGGSASLLPYYAVTPYEGISAKVTSGKVTYVEGASGYKMLPVIGPNTFMPSGKKGVVFRTFVDGPEVLTRRHVDELELRMAEMFFVDYAHPAIKGKPVYYGEVLASFIPEESGEYKFGVTVYGTAKLFVDDQLIVDNESVQRPGESFFTRGTLEEVGTVLLEAGKSYDIKVTFGSAKTSKLKSNSVSFAGGGLRVGLARVIDESAEIESAVAVAKSVDQVVLCVGLSADWESEGYDRRHLDLPGKTNELVSRVLEGNPNTVVVVQSGMPVEMPWITECNAVMEAWYGGNETGNAIADVLFGDVNPSGKLPVTFPKKVQDNPTFLNFRSERGRTLYGEDVYIGYRFYESLEKEVLFPFGHGLSYSTFTLSDLSVIATDNSITVTTGVHNTSGPDGAEVVQVYIKQHDPSVNRPPKELKGFRKVFVPAGETKSVEVEIDLKYATSFYDETRKAWISEQALYSVLVGTTSQQTLLEQSFTTAKTFWWTGL